MVNMSQRSDGVHADLDVLDLFTSRTDKACLGDLLLILNASLEKLRVS